MSIGIARVHLPLSNTSTMAFRRAESKDTVERTTWVAAKQVSMSLPTHEDINLFVEKDIKQQHHNEKHYSQQIKSTYRMKQMQRMQEEGC